MTPIWSALDRQGTLNAMKTALPVAAAAVILAPLLLAGCASNEGTNTPETTGGTATDAVSAPADTSAPTATSTSSGTPAARPTSEPPPTALPSTYGDVNQTITDDSLKDSITVKRIARDLPWPSGYKASSEAYELVALEMTWTPSKDYTIPIRKQDFAINSGTDFPNRPDPLINETLNNVGWQMLPDAIDKGDAITGWLVFKVDPRKAQKLTLDYTRPAVQVTSGGRGNFPSKAFSVTLVG